MNPIVAYLLVILLVIIAYFTGIERGKDQRDKIIARIIRDDPEKFISFILEAHEEIKNFGEDCRIDFKFTQNKKGDNA